MQTKTAGIRDAKMHLSKYLKMVRGGGEVVLTDRGRPVGKIVPIENKDVSLSFRIKTLEDQGLLEIPSQKGRGKVASPIPISGDIAQRFLKEDRGHE